MTKKYRVISMALIVALCTLVLCTAGITLAIGTSANRSNGSITTAGLSIESLVKNVAVFTAVAASEGESETFQFDGRYYKYQQSNIKNNDGTILFGDRASGGVRFDDKSVTLENVLPGDKVEFDIEVSSNSSIAFRYRAELFVDANSGEQLLNNLNFNSSNGLRRRDVQNSAAKASNDALSAAILTDYTQWTTLGANKTDVETIHVSIDLPLNAVGGMGETVKLFCVARAEQSIATNAPVAQVEQNGFIKIFDKVRAAVEYAIENRIDTVTLIGSTNCVENNGVITTLDEGEIVVSRALTFNAKADVNGNVPVINGARFVVKEGATATFNGIHFSGASFVDVSDATALTMNDCFADVAFASDEGYFDQGSSAREFLKNTPFIVSGTSLTPVTLKLNNNKILSDGGAVGLRSPLNNGSNISNNSFGSAERRVTAEAALLICGAANDSGVDKAKAFVTVESNSFFAETAVSLGSKLNSAPYVVLSRNNVLNASNGKVFAMGAADNGGAICGAFVDFGSTVNGGALQLENINAARLKFAGINVTVNAINLIVSGEVVLSNVEKADFDNNYTAGENTAGTIIVRAKG